MDAGAERSDTGVKPLLSSGTFYRRAHEIESLARIIMECTAGGSHRADRTRAEQLMKKIGAIAGKESDE
jgi:hypothetical protein